MRGRWLVLVALVGVTVILAYALLVPGGGPAGGGETVVSPPPLPSFLEGVKPGIRVSSPAFGEGERIPVRYTCDGEDVSPPLRLENVPGDAKSLALIVYDPDAPVGWFTHWLLYSIPPTVSEIPEAVPKKPEVPGLGLQGVNDFGYTGYGGPCPPRGHGVHRYVFLVVALDSEPRLSPGMTYHQLVEAIRKHVIAYGYTYGTYSR